MTTDERLDELKLSVQSLDRKLDAVLVGLAHEHPVDRSLRLAEFDDEPYTEDQQARVRASLEGPFFSAEQVWKDLGVE